MLSTTVTALPVIGAGKLPAYLDGLNRPFACIYRPQPGASDTVLFLEGKIDLLPSLAALSLDIPASDGMADTMSQLILLPFNQLKEKGYACIDDHERVIVMHIDKQAYYPVSQFMAAIEDSDIQPNNIHFDLDDTAYAEIVDTVINQEINAGEGSNFVISRSLEGAIVDFNTRHALNLFKRLVRSECGSYWTWMVYTGSRYFIGSTPEQHIQVNEQNVSMNPISGTLRYPDEQNLEGALQAFLKDEKECNELFMVVDEELKMMSNICQRNIKVSGPKLKAMSHIAHTEYFIDGQTDRALKDIIKHSLFAPTVTGSPIESACRVIARRERRGRGYYSGIVAMMGNHHGKRYLDSAIIIRTADITSQGNFRLTAGSTIVRDSVPYNEAGETRAKLQGLMHSFFGKTGASSSPMKTGLPEELKEKANRLLAQRNEKASAFWLRTTRQNEIQVLPHIKIILVDMEDTFTEMIAYQLRSAGCAVTIIPWHESRRRLPQLMSPTGNDILFIGPGPGDPTNLQLEKIQVARKIIAQQLEARRPLIGTCLGHQLICAELGLPIIRLPKNRQGSQYRVTIQEKSYFVGFYNSFSATYNEPQWYNPTYEKRVDLERIPSNEVIALSSENLASIQFHNESFLTQDPFSIYQWLIKSALRKTEALEEIDTF